MHLVWGFFFKQQLLIVFRRFGCVPEGEEDGLEASAVVLLLLLFGVS